MHNISIKKMRVFVSSVEQGSFTEGARRSNISQPAAVSIISEIEETVGDPLFSRAGKTRRATLTQRGEEVYQTFTRTLSVYDRALEAISNGKRQRRAHKIFIQSPYVASVSALWLHEMAAQETGSRLSIRSAGWREISSAIESREDCIALIDGEIRQRSTEYLSIGNVEIVLVVPESNHLFTTDQQTILWEDVPPNALIYSDICPTTFERVYEGLRKATGANTFTDVNSPSILKNICLKTGVPAIVPKNLIDVFGNEIRLRCLSFSYSKPLIPLGISISHGNSMRKKIIGRNIERVFENRFFI